MPGDGVQVEGSGPLFQTAEAGNTSIRVTHNEGLHARGDELRAFEIAAADGRFARAIARVVDNAVVVSSSSVAHPRLVRYARSNFTDANLYNGANLPAAAFSSGNKK